MRGRVDTHRSVLTAGKSGQKRLLMSILAYAWKEPMVDYDLVGFNPAVLMIEISSPFVLIVQLAFKDSRKQWKKSIE